VLEAKRADDARHVRELETRLADAETFVALRPKLQAKLNSQQTELIATRRELADAQQLAQLAESRIVDAQEQLEMAMLDKEVAEERAEGAEAELEEVTERLAIVEVELGVLKEGGEEGGEGEGEEAGNKSMSAGKDSLAYIQLEKHNDRLKEALLRLRDMSQETEQEQRRRIAEMEKDIVGVDELQCTSDFGPEMCSHFLQPTTKPRKSSSPMPRFRSRISRCSSTTRSVRRKCWCSSRSATSCLARCVYPSLFLFCPD
jgi:dynactin 1